jgi:hypothetical protein
MGKECGKQDYLVSFLVVSSLDWHVVKYKERGERGETADRMPILWGLVIFFISTSSQHENGFHQLSKELSLISSQRLWDVHEYDEL